MSKPVVYACSGCSNVARIAHDIALNLDSDGLAEMSCVSGVAANVDEMKNTATSAYQTIAIDGCELACTKLCLDNASVNVDHYFVVTDMGIEKRDKWQDSIIDNSKALNFIYKSLKEKGIEFNV